jgi:hypothetical protein
LRIALCASHIEAPKVAHQHMQQKLVVGPSVLGNDRRALGQTLDQVAHGLGLIDMT